MGLRRLFRVAAACAAAASLACTAAADIKAYNAAVKAGDYRTAAGEAEATWKTWDKSDPQTALMAREFGFAALVAGRNELARDFGKFLVDNGSGLATPDDQPLVSAVLYRAADLKVAKGRVQGEALRQALAARSSVPGLDMTSVLAWEFLYTFDWNEGDWKSVSADADAAAGFLGRSKSTLARQREAQRMSAAAAFVENRDRLTTGRNKLYESIADVHDAIANDIDTTTSQAMRKQLWDIKWKTEAWAIAIASYLTSSYQQVGSTISTKLEPRALKQPEIAELEEESSLPVCKGSFDGPRLVYPNTKKFFGVGAMIARLETGENGKVTKVTVLAALPDPNFVSGLADTMRQWTYKPEAGQDMAACRLNSANHLQKIIFRIL